MSSHLSSQSKPFDFVLLNVNKISTKQNQYSSFYLQEQQKKSTILENEMDPPHFVEKIYYTSERAYMLTCISDAVSLTKFRLIFKIL